MSNNVVKNLFVGPSDSSPETDFKCYEFSWTNGSLELQSIQFNSTQGEPDLLLDSGDPIANVLMPIDLSQNVADIKTGIIAAMALYPQLTLSDVVVTDNGTDTSVTFLSFDAENYFPFLFSVDGNGALINEIVCPTELTDILDNNNISILDNNGQPLNYTP